MAISYKKLWKLLIDKDYEEKRLATISWNQCGICYEAWQK